MKKQLGTALFAVALTVGMATTVAADTSQESDVTVSVASQTAIDVKPDAFSYTSIDPGTVENESENGFTALEVENIGSNEIDEIWADASQPEDRPFGTGNADDYDAGNFIQLSLESADNADDWENIPGGVMSEDTFHYVNRVEWEEPKPSFVQIGDLGSGGDEGLDVGRFRNGSQEFYYTIEYDSTATNSADNACHGEADGAHLYVSNDATTADNRGNVDFSEGSNYDEYDITTVQNDDGYGVASSSVTIGDAEYSVLTYCDSTTGEVSDGHTVWTRYNTDFESDSSISSLSNTGDINSGSTNPILTGTTSSNVLQPGQSFPVDMRIQVPQGVTQGEVGEGTLTLMSTADFQTASTTLSDSTSDGSDTTYTIYEGDSTASEDEVDSATLSDGGSADFELADGEEFTAEAGDGSGNTTTFNGGDDIEWGGSSWS